MFEFSPVVATVLSLGILFVAYLLVRKTFYVRIPQDVVLIKQGLRARQKFSGCVLEDVCIDYLEQTPIKDIDPNNVIDAEGMRRIKQLIENQKL